MLRYRCRSSSTAVAVRGLVILCQRDGRRTTPVARSRVRRGDRRPASLDRRRTERDCYLAGGCVCRSAASWPRDTCDRVHHPECVVAPGEATRVGVLGIGFGRRGSGADLADVVHAREASVNPFLQVEAMVRGDVRRAYTIFPDHIVLGLAGVHAAGRWQVFGLTHAADGDWNPLAGCFGAGSYHVRCSAGTVLVDTGVGTTIFSVPNHASGAVAPGTPLSIRIAGPPKLSFAFTSSGSDCSSLALSCARWSQRTRYPIAVNTSRRLIQAADYRFDDVCGQVAFRRTPDRPFP
jgi:hypothetical protein